MMVCQLGRNGDIINVLPLAFALSRKLGKVQWLVGAEHASILEGVSYVNPVIWSGGQDTLHQALRAYQGANPICLQAFLNPDNRQMTDSFAKEQWRYAGMLDQRDSWPLVFDQQNHARANMLKDRVLSNRRRDKPVVLCSTESISTPYPHANKLIAIIRSLDADVIDMNDVKADRIYDLLALYDAADCIVTVDTAHSHLARASNCPVVMLVNDGWRGSVPPPQTIASWRYAELGDDLSPVLKAVKKQLARKADSIAVVIHTYKPGHGDRHKRAIATHPKDTIYFERSYRPKMTEYFEAGLESGKQVIVMSNDDVSFPKGSLDKIRQHAQKWDFGCSRRPREPVHVGREVFWCRADWLRANLSRMPAPYWSVQKPDIIMARWMRGLRGIKTTYANLEFDFPPVELPAGIITHTEHSSHWANAETENSMEGRHNEELWRAMA